MFRRSLCDMTIWRYAVCEPYVAANRRSFTDGDAPEHGGACINHHVIFNDGMPRLTFGKAAVVVGDKTFGTERDRLIDAHAFADDGGFANHDAGAMIDKKTFTDLRARMNIDTGFGMRELGNNACDQ